MIASLRGRVQGKGENNLVVEVGGIGLRVLVPTGLVNEATPGEEVHLHTHLVVREDALTLFGFQQQDELEFFELLLGVTGVGPRTALAVISTLSVDAIRRSIIHDQVEVLGRVPGVGKKTAQRIMLHLHDKLGELTGLEGMPTLDVDTQVIEALTGLGYSVIEAQAALQSIPKDAPQDVEARLRFALQYFSV
jgi:Holliday junction DNA helicase RuvA